jgi:hypothetical protein
VAHHVPHQLIHGNVYHVILLLNIQSRLARLVGYSPDLFVVPQQKYDYSLFLLFLIRALFSHLYDTVSVFFFPSVFASGLSDSKRLREAAGSVPAAVTMPFVLRRARAATSGISTLASAVNW